MGTYLLFDSMSSNISQTLLYLQVEGGPSSSSMAGGVQEGSLTEDEQIAMAIAMSMEASEKPEDSGKALHLIECA